MAAIDGHIEASMALAYRLEHSNGCDAAIPYKEAAAHAIMDALEADIHSRAKITPPMDKHALPEIHTHGGTSSQLEWDNKPNESPEAVQYYHIRATAPSAPDLHAAYTLGHLYHYGLRGVDWNITKALQYYEIAANAGHWEAAGQAGKFHFWSLGVTERSLVKAHKYFSMGAPYGLEGCRTRYRNALKKKVKADESPVTVCDHPSLNGMGLLHLFGVHMVVPINVEKAKQFFVLARDMGNMDASYNLAMLRLGWKHAWKEQDETGFTSLDVPEFMNAPLNSPNPADFGFAVQELANAANKGHLQARHRLAMLHHHGVTLPGHSTPTIPPDCTKAMVHYQWIMDHAAIPWSQRTRMAYDQYMRGDLDASLRNYMLAAETGHAISQVNAAFLLERGTCLGLAPMECRKAALRWWKAAAQQGHAEAALRVGDFYYFGNSETLSWLRPVLFPEKIVVPMVMGWYDWIQTTLLGQAPAEPMYGDTPPTCSLDEDTDDPSCPNNMNVPNTTTKSDFAKAAQYYRMASERHKSPRAHFNLGYMHEWGLGLQQDFPLAKRHYDLAQSSSKNQGEADFAVQLALLGMKIHENYDKAMVWWRDYQKRRIDGEPILEPVPLPTSTTMTIVIKHVLCWESLLIIVLTIVLSKVLQFRTVR
jgi:TPR repeat protein